MVDFDKIFIDVMKVIESDLPDYLVYHNLDHTKYVLDKSILIAQHEGLNEYDLSLVKIAAIYHDIGFIKNKDNHEAIGCTIAKESLMKHGLAATDVDKICGMIMATKIPQTPSSPLEMILADADLEYLGTAEFEPVSEKLFQELQYFNPNLGRQEWYQIQINFLSAHKYHTEFCQNNREPKKAKNLASIIQKIS